MIGIWYEKLKGKVVIDYSFYLMIGEIMEDVLNEFFMIIEKEGIIFFKVFMVYKNVF